MLSDRLSSLGVAFTLWSLTVVTVPAAERWQRLESGLGSATIFGNLRAQWPLAHVDLGSGDSLMLCLVHRVLPVGDSARSVFEVPQLSSWILEVEPGHLLWTPPYLQRREFYLREGQWRSNPNDGTRVVELATGRWQVTEPNGDRYLYTDGDLRELQLGGRVLKVECVQGQIKTVIESESNRALISAEYSQDGDIRQLNTLSERIDFKWENHLLKSVTTAGKIFLTFAYESELITSVAGGPGNFTCTWIENPYSKQGYTALNSPVIISSDGATQYRYSIKDAVVTLQSELNSGHISALHFFSRTARIVREEIK